MALIDLNAIFSKVKESAKRADIATTKGFIRQ